MSQQVGGRKVRDEADARGCFAEMERSGMTVFAWARSSGVCARSLYRWRDSLGLRTPAPGIPRSSGTSRKEKGRTGRKTVPSSKQDLDATPLRLVEVVGCSPAPPLRAPRYEVVVGELRLVVEDDFTEGTLARLLRVVRGC